MRLGCLVELLALVGGMVHGALVTRLVERLSLVHLGLLELQFLGKTAVFILYRYQLESQLVYFLGLPVHLLLLLHQVLLHMLGLDLHDFLIRLQLDHLVLELGQLPKVMVVGGLLGRGSGLLRGVGLDVGV